MRVRSRPQPGAPPPAGPGSERLHIWKACPPRPTGGRTSGNTCSPPWEWSSLPRGRKGRRRGRRASLTSVGCRCADGATARPAAAGLDGARGPWGAQERDSSCPTRSTSTPAAALLSRSLPPSPATTTGAFWGAAGGAGAEGVARTQVRGLGQSPPPPHFDPHLPVLLLLPLRARTPRGGPTVRGLPSPPMLPPLLWLLGPVAETLILVQFRGLRGLRAEAERAGMFLGLGQMRGRGPTSPSTPPPSLRPWVPSAGDPICPRGSTPRLGRGPPHCQRIPEGRIVSPPQTGAT